ncbi:MAG: hypothetical protein H6R19_1828 [Proteobacteria bacterium]|nr:hypothetical protein [Pseudomonadota bacterium]
MKPLHIEFCRDGRTGRSTRGLWLLLLTGILLVGLGIGMGTVFSERARLHSEEARELLDERASLNDAARQQERLPAEMVESINGAVRMLDYPSIELLSQLEKHVRPDVSVVGIEMGPVRTNLRIVVQAAAAPQVLDYLDAIKAEPGFRGVALTRQEATNGEDAAGGSWRFTLEVPQADAVARASARMPKGQEE